MKILVIFFSIAILILDYAALNDLTKGNEQNYYGEYIFLLFSLIYFGIAIVYYFKRQVDNSSN